MSLLYNISIYSYHLLISVSSLFNEKARLWLMGRKNIFFSLSDIINTKDKFVWFHVASLGEFEQGRPVIEAFREKFPQYKILLTFFSPSGYEIRKDYKGADFIFYLPIDTKINAQKFIQIVNPKLAIFIKYEFWFNYLDVLHKKNIPVFIISAIFRKEQHFFKWYGGWFRKMLKKITFFFVQNRSSLELLDSIGIKNAKISGDTRFDRVFAISQKTQKYPLVAKFTEGKKVFLAGSTWQPDEELIEQLADKNKNDIKFIIAPHEVHEERIRSLISRFGKHKVLRHSESDEININHADILIIDGIGFLSSLYQYCDVAYIGGGFGKGIHNILEAATFGKPVIFGPNYFKFQEAVELISQGGAISVNNINELFKNTDKLLKEADYYRTCSEICKNYIISKCGATHIILDNLQKIINI